MAEFALIAPMGFLLILSIVVIGIVTTNFIQVTNIARDGARMAAICAGEPTGGTIPDGSGNLCTVTNLQNYMTARLTSIPASVNPTIQVCSPGCQNFATGDLPQQCNHTSLIQVTMSYAQPLYLPLVSSFFESTPGSGNRTLQAKAQAGCE